VPALVFVFVFLFLFAIQAETAWTDGNGQFSRSRPELQTAAAGIAEAAALAEGARDRSSDGVLRSSVPGGYRVDSE